MYARKHSRVNQRYDCRKTKFLRAAKKKRTKEKKTINQRLQSDVKSEYFNCLRRHSLVTQPWYSEVKLMWMTIPFLPFLSLSLSLYIYIYIGHYVELFSGVYRVLYVNCTDLIHRCFAPKDLQYWSDHFHSTTVFENLNLCLIDLAWRQEEASDDFEPQTKMSLGSWEAITKTKRKDTKHLHERHRKQCITTSTIKFDSCLPFQKQSRKSWLARSHVHCQMYVLSWPKSDVVRVGNSSLTLFESDPGETITS